MAKGFKELSTNWNRKGLDENNRMLKELYEGVENPFIEEGSIGSDKLTDTNKNVTFAIATNKPNYDSKSNTLFFSKSTDGSQDLIMYGNQDSKNRFYLKKEGTSIVNSFNQTTANLIFNTSSKTFKFEMFNYELGNFEISLGSIDKKSEFPSFIFDCLIDGKQPIKPVNTKAEVLLAVGTPVYSTKEAALTFADTTNATYDILTYGDNSSKYRFNIPHATKVINDFKGTTSIFIVNVKTKEFSFKQWDYQLSADEFVLGKMRYNAFIYDFDFPVIIDEIEKKPLERISMWSSGSYIEVDMENAKLVFKSGIINSNDWTFSAYGLASTGVLKDGLEIVVPENINNSTTSSAILLYNIKTKEFIWDIYSNLKNYKEPFALFGLVSKEFNSKGGLSRFDYDFNFPVIQNNLQNGIKPINNDVFFIHHRGYSWLYPENTLRAWRESKKVGVNDVECDVRWTKDNVPVTIHDITINRTARNVDGSEISNETKITDITLEDVKKLDFGVWKGEEFKGEQIPTFEEMVAQCKILNQRIHLDAGWIDFTEERIIIMKNILKKYNFDKVVFYSNRDYYSYMLRKHFPFCDLAILEYENLTDEAISHAKKYNTSKAHAHLICRARNLTNDMAKKVKENSLQLWLWGADNLELEPLIINGVNGISSDYMYEEKFI